MNAVTDNSDALSNDEMRTLIDIVGAEHVAEMINADINLRFALSQYSDPISIERINLHTKERYFLDFTRIQKKGSVRWVRMPNLTYYEAIKFQNQMLWDSLNSIENGEGSVRYENIRLHSEISLDEMVELDNGTTCTKREQLFGSMYQSVREQFLAGSPLHDEKKVFFPLVNSDDHYEEVVEDLKEMYPDGLDWDEYDSNNL